MSHLLCLPFPSYRLTSLSKTSSPRCALSDPTRPPRPNVMELTTPPPQDLAASASTNPFATADDVAGNPFLTTAATVPPSPNPFELLPSSVSDADPFDLFQHFTNAPASPTGAAAIYAQFSSVDGNGADHDRSGDDDDFQPRVSYSTVTSTMPFEWEEKPGKPKLEFACTAATAANGDVDDTDFDFGVLLDKSAQAPELTTADELFDEGKIRPLKPPPRLLDGGSVGSSPRSPMSRAAMWSPRLRSLVGPSADFDPFAAAMAKAAKAPSPLGAGGKDAADIGTTTLPKNPDSVTSPPSIPPATNNGWRKKWRLSDLLLFRGSSAKARAAGNISKDPVFKYSPVQHLGTPVKKATLDSVAAHGDVSAGKHKRQSKKSAAAAEGGVPAPHRKSVIGCVRLNSGLHRLAKGLNGSSSHFSRRTGRSAMNG